MVARELAEAYPVTAVCELLAMPRSSYYYQPVAKNERELIAAIEKVVGEWPTYGNRRVTAQLKREQWPVKQKKKGFR